MGQLTIKCTKGNEPKGSLHVKIPNCLKCKNATINPENIDNTCFQYFFTLTPHYKEIKNNAERVSSIKPFIDLYFWDCLNYPTVINNNCSLFERKNLEMAVVVP